MVEKVKQLGKSYLVADKVYYEFHVDSIRDSQWKDLHYLVKEANEKTG